MILVTGALGFVGRHLVAALVDAEQPVRIFVPQRWHHRLPYAKEVQTQVDVVAGTIFDHPALYRAMTGVHTVFHLASAQWWGSPDDLEYIDLEGTRHVLTAARAARVGRFITLSHIGAEVSSAYALLRIKGQMEQEVRRSGLAYTILRCGILFGEQDHFVNNIGRMLRNNPFVVFQPAQGESLLHPLHIDDLIAGLVATLDALELVDETVEIGGPEYISYSDLLRTVMRVSRARRGVVSAPPYLMRAVSGIMRLLPVRSTVTPQWYDYLASNRTAHIGNLYNYLGVRPRRFEDTLLTYMPHRRYFFEYVRYLLSRRKRSAF